MYNPLLIFRKQLSHDEDHVELWQALVGLFEEFQSLERRNLLRAGDRSDPLDLYCLHQAYLPKVRLVYKNFYSARSKQPKRRSTKNPNYPRGVYTRYELYSCWEKAGYPISAAQINAWEQVGLAAWGPRSHAPRPHEVDPNHTAVGRALRRLIVHHGGIPLTCEGRYMKLRAAARAVNARGL